MSYTTLGPKPRPPNIMFGGGKDKDDPIKLLDTVRLWEPLCEVLMQHGPEGLTNEHRSVLRWLADWGVCYENFAEDRFYIVMPNGLRLQLPDREKLPRSSQRFLNTVFRIGRSEDIK